MGNIIKMKWKQKGMSAAERRKYGVEEIPVSEIRERANELGISSATVKELLTPTTNHSQKISYHSPIHQKRSYNDAEGCDTRNVL